MLIADPPVTAGAVKATDSWALPGVIESIVGESGMLVTVALDVLVPEVEPLAFLRVVTTFIANPRSEEVNTYVLETAPVIAVPPRCHW